MKQLLLVFALFTLFATATLAQRRSEKITNLDAKNAVIYTDNNYTAVLISGCFKDRGSILERFDILFTPPTKTPDSYFIRWTARKDGKWQPIKKANSKRAGNFNVRADWVSTLGGDWHSDPADAATVYVTINSSMHKLAAPVGEQMKVMIRPVYGERKGPKTRIDNINTYEWHMTKRPHLADC